MNLSEWACVECTRVYNPFLGDRYWRGLTIGGTEYGLLCDDCRRDLERAVGDAEAAAPA